MKRMKTFFIYAILVAVVIIASDFIINICLKTGYREIKNYKIENGMPAITINEAKTTNMNGYILGTLTNNSKSDIDKAFVKVDLFSIKGNNIGTEYYEINNLKQNEAKEFKINYRQDNVDSFTISVKRDGECQKGRRILTMLYCQYSPSLLTFSVPFDI